MNNSIYPDLETVDIYQTTYLKLCGHTPSLKLKSGKVVFVFPGSAKLYGAVNEYTNNATVKVLDFSETFRQLRSSIYETKKMGGI